MITLLIKSDNFFSKDFDQGIKLSSNKERPFGFASLNTFAYPSFSLSFRITDNNLNQTIQIRLCHFGSS
jgi:hypothetical protein